MSESNCLKNLFFQKSGAQKEQKFTNLYKEILLRQKIISNIQKKIESQIIIKDDNREIVVESQQENPIDNPLYMKYAKYKNKIRNIFQNKKLITLLRKRKSNIYLYGDEENLFKNLFLSPLKDSSNNENKNKNLKLNINKRKEKKFHSHILRNNSFEPIKSSKMIINNTVSNKEKIINEYNRKNIMNYTYYKKLPKGESFKRNISLNQINISESNNKMDISHQNDNSIFNNNIISSRNDTRNKANLYSGIDSKIYNSETRNYSHDYYISNYTEKKEKGNYFNKKSLYSFKNKNNSKESLLSNVSNLISSRSRFKDIISTPTNNKKKNLFLNSEEKNSSKKYILRKNKESPLSKKITFIKINNLRAKREKSFKQFSNTFKNSIYKKMKSLNHITNICNTELTKLINTNNTENKENFKNKTKALNDKIREELDIRKDIIDKDSIDKNNEGKIKKYKVLMDNVKMEMNLSEGEDKSIMNLLKKKINIISDSIALNMIEKGLGIKKNMEFDVNELFNEHIKKKNDIQREKIKEIRKKAENNYIKMVKLRHTLSSSKY